MLHSPVNSTDSGVGTRDHVTDSYNHANKMLKKLTKFGLIFELSSSWLSDSAAYQDK